MNIVETKKIIQDLCNKSKSISGDFDKKSTQIQLIQPFFEALEWDFQTDVKTPIDDIADKEFQIDGVTRFYLKILPYGTSIESSREIIESLIQGFSQKQRDKIYIDSEYVQTIHRGSIYEQISGLIKLSRFDFFRFEREAMALEIPLIEVRNIK